MNKNKYISFTLLLLLLNGCSTPNIETKPSAIQASKKPDEIKIPPSTTPSPIESNLSPSPINSIMPSDQNDDILDDKERQTFNGRVVDSNNIPVEGAKVSARSIDPGVNWVGKEQITSSNGDYIFKNAPVGARLAITVTKDGWTTRDRAEVVKSGDAGWDANIFNFNDIYSIQEEPEIRSLKVNGRQVLGATSGSSASSIGGVFTITPVKYTNISQLTSTTPVITEYSKGKVADTYNPSLTGINNDKLEIEMTFSEPVNREDVENYFRVSPQIFPNKSEKGFIIDKNIVGSTFRWSDDDMSVVFKTNKSILANKEGDEAKYAIDFLKPFRDKAGNFSKSQRYFRFSPSQINDFAIFSVKNDKEAPALLSIIARDSLPSDSLELKFSEPMVILNYSIFSDVLAYPNAPTNIQNQLCAYSTNNPDGNNATVLGYINSDSKFIANYVIGKISLDDINKLNMSKMLKLSALGTSTNQFPNVPTPFAGTDIYGYRLKSLKTVGNSIFIEFTSQAFNKGDRIIVSAGANISAKYSDKNVSTTSIDLNPNLNLPTDSKFSEIQDPAGNIINNSKPSLSNNIDVNNQQKITAVN